MNLNWSKLIPLNQSSTDQATTSPGVFRLVYKAADGAYYVFFVGSAKESLRKELVSITQGTVNNACVKIHLENLECYFRFATVDIQDVDNVLRTVFEHYKPKCNLEIPKGRIVEELNFN